METLLEKHSAGVIDRVVERAIANHGFAELLRGVRYYQVPQTHRDRINEALRQLGLHCSTWLHPDSR